MLQDHGIRAISSFFHRLPQDLTSFAHTGTSEFGQKARRRDQHIFFACPFKHRGMRRGERLEVVVNGTLGGERASRGFDAAAESG